MANDIPLKVKRAAASFNKNRAEYYSYLSSMLSASKGNTKFSTLFDRDAQRYEKTPRGILCSYWAELYMANGGNLGLTWEGTLPDDEVAIIRVAQDAGDSALLSALSDVARIAKLSDTVKSAVISTLAVAVAAIAIATLMLTIFPIFAAQKFMAIYSFIPVEEWGSSGKGLLHHAKFVQTYGIYVVLAFVGLIIYIQWTISNLVGPIRDWLDEKFVLYRAIRDIKGALFLATMSTLTRKRGNISFTLRDSLSLFAANSRSRWLRWRVEQVVAGVDQTGAIGTDAFDTPLLSREMFFYLRDTQEARGFAEGFVETGNYVESHILESIIKRMKIYQLIFLLFSVLCGVYVVSNISSVIFEMKGVMQNYYSSK